MRRSIIAGFLVLVLLVSAGLSVELVSARQLDQTFPTDLTPTDTPPVIPSETPSPTVPVTTPEDTATPADSTSTPEVIETTELPALTETPTTTSSSILPDGYVEYRDDQYGFGFLYPTDMQPKSWEPAADILSSLSFHFGEYNEGEKSEISISVLANPDQLSIQEWIETHSPADLTDLPESLVNTGIIFENASSSQCTCQQS